jgi:flagellar basal-body rod protein FlgB
MIEALLGNSNYVAAKKMLDANVLRYEAISSNLTNIETPAYKRLDVTPSFESQLSQAVTSKDTNQMAALNPTLSVDQSANTGREDGNTVSLEGELLQMDKNLVEHAMETQLISGSLLKMRMAITGKT